MKWRISGMVAVSFCALASTAMCGPTVLPAGSTVAGKSIGSWTADWWNWVSSVPGNAFSDTTGSLQTVNQSGPVFFLAGTQGGAGVTRSFNIPAGKFVLLPLINWNTANGADPGFASTEAEAAALVDGTVDTSKLFASVDGVDVLNLASHREKAPANFTQTVKPGTTGFPAGTYTDANSDGYWLMLSPLSAGAHTLHFGGTTKDFVGPDPAITVPSFTVDVTDNVHAGSTAAIPLPPGALAALPALAVGMLVVMRTRKLARR